MRPRYNVSSLWLASKEAWKHGRINGSVQNSLSWLSVHAEFNIRSFPAFSSKLHEVKPYEHFLWDLSFLSSFFMTKKADGGIEMTSWVVGLASLSLVPSWAVVLTGEADGGIEMTSWVVGLASLSLVPSWAVVLTGEADGGIEMTSWAVGLASLSLVPSLAVVLTGEADGGIEMTTWAVDLASLSLVPSWAVVLTGEADGGIEMTSWVVVDLRAIRRLILILVPNSSLFLSPLSRLSAGYSSFHWAFQ
jgi:hypothetical protein